MLQTRAAAIVALACLAASSGVLSISAASAQPLSVAPSAGLSGTVVTIATGLTSGPSTCTLLLDTVIQRSFDCGPRSSIQYTVLARPGPHMLTVCAPSCDSVDAVPTESSPFTVLAQVPDLTGHTAAELPKTVAAAGLTLGRVDGQVGATVSAQDPPAGTVVAPGSAVEVTLGVTTTPSPVVVPDVRRLSAVRARRIVLGLGLRFVARSRTGYVRAQVPAPGSTVAAGSAVTVVLTSRIVVRYVDVPDVRGDSLGAARHALTAAGLALTTPTGGGTVATQSPSPGRRVLLGSGVTVTLVAAVAPASARPGRNRSFWWPGAIAVVVVALVATAASRHHRRRRHVDPGPMAHVTWRLTTDLVHTDPGGSTGPTVELRTRARTGLTIERIP